MREIKEIIVHCADTPEGRDDRAADIKRWHTKERGWSDIGYHYVIDLDGTIEPGRPIETAGAHCTGHNANSIGICYVGGCDEKMKPKDTRTDAQKASLQLLLKYLVAKYPNATIYGHRDFNPGKSCPSFDAKEEYKALCGC
jgi:N-acetylmuramoyl-L-alanine amidase